MPPAYIHLRCEIIGRFVQAYVPCTTAVFIPPLPPSPRIHSKLPASHLVSVFSYFVFLDDRTQARHCNRYSGSTGGRKYADASSVTSTVASKRQCCCQYAQGTIRSSPRERPGHKQRNNQRHASRIHPVSSQRRSNA